MNLKMFEHHFKSKQAWMFPTEDMGEDTHPSQAHTCLVPSSLHVHTDTEHEVLGGHVLLSHISAWEPGSDGQGQNLHKAQPETELTDV